jgi:two-component system, cell cycle response regulator DivK
MPKILVVEDDLDNMEIILRFLKMRKFEVVTALDGPSGVAQALSEKPDLILMDMGLPNPEDGLEATRRIRAQAGTETIPIIAFTARSMAQDKEKARAAGCTDFESKPVDFKRLLVKIHNCLPRTELS